MLPRRFALVRHVDYTGVSGIGVVAYGVAFADGQIVLRWCSTHPATSLWSSLNDLLAVHGHGEATSIEWIDAPHGEVGELPPAKTIGRRAKRSPEDAAEDVDQPVEPSRASTARPAPEPAASEPPTPAPATAVPAPSTEAPAQAPPEPTPEPPPEPLAPLPRRPVRLVTRGERDPINGRLSTDTAPLLFDPIATEPPRRTPEPESTPQDDQEPPRRPGRHRRPDPNNGAR